MQCRRCAHLLRASSAPLHVTAFTRPHPQTHNKRIQTLVNPPPTAHTQSTSPCSYMETWLGLTPMQAGPRNHALSFPPCLAPADLPSSLPPCLPVWQPSHVHVCLPVCLPALSSCLCSLCSTAGLATAAVCRCTPRPCWLRGGMTACEKAARPLPLSVQIVMTSLVVINTICVLPADPGLAHHDLHAWLQGGYLPREPFGQGCLCGGPARPWTCTQESGAARPSIGGSWRQACAAGAPGRARAWGC